LVFKIAASMAVKSGMATINPILREPFMKITVDTLEEYIGKVMLALNARIGCILVIENKHEKQVITV